MGPVLLFFKPKFHPVYKLALIALLVFMVFAKVVPTSGQVGQPEGPVYIVREGDSLWDIAVRFGVSLQDLQTANGISDAGSLAPGEQLVIPGLPGISGILDSLEVPFGETLRSLSRRYRLTEDELARLNHLTNPEGLFVGSNLILPADRLETEPSLKGSLQPGQSLLEFAVLEDANPWSVVAKNELPGSWAALPGDVLLLPEPGPGGPAALPEFIGGISLDPLPLTQGSTVVIRMTGWPGTVLSGSLAGRELHFFPSEDGYVALQGIHAMTEPGLYPLSLKIVPPDGEGGEKTIYQFSQQVLINSADYPLDPVLTVDPQTIDPAVTEPEDQLWASLGVSFTPDKSWAGTFQSPVPSDLKDCWTSRFGSRRSFNGSPYRYFHSGLDFCGTVGTELYAAGPGKVVYTGALTVRGNVVVIDHGWGIFTAYDHLSETIVKPGAMVQSGQLIGLGGKTGRTTGPHLHWEVWVGGVQVDPIPWLEKSFP